MPKKTTRERLEDLISRNPARSLQELSDIVGVSRQRVRELLAALGYEYEEPKAGRWVRG